MKTNSIVYWTATGLIIAGSLMSSFMSLSQNPEMVKNMTGLGLPAYFMGIIGTAKFLGVVGLVNPWWPKVKEWAYAGFTFVYIGATWIHLATNTPFVAPLVFLAILGVSYFFNQRKGHAFETLPNRKQVQSI